MRIEISLHVIVNHFCSGNNFEQSEVLYWVEWVRILLLHFLHLLRQNATTRIGSANKCVCTLLSYPRINLLCNFLRCDRINFQLLLQHFLSFGNCSLHLARLGKKYPSDFLLQSWGKSIRIISKQYVTITKRASDYWAYLIDWSDCNEAEM